MVRCTGKGRSGIECLIAGVWKLREIRRNASTVAYFRYVKPDCMVLDKIARRKYL